MMGQHARSESLFYYFRLEDQIPEDHLLRLINEHIDFGFVRGQLKDSYSDTGRPSIDPELLLRILLIGYLYGISSERKLVEELRMHLAWRWFTGLGFDQEIPHHSHCPEHQTTGPISESTNDIPNTCDCLNTGSNTARVIFRAVSTLERQNRRRLFQHPQINALIDGVRGCIGRPFSAIGRGASVAFPQLASNVLARCDTAPKPGSTSGLVRGIPTADAC